MAAEARERPGRRVDGRAAPVLNRASYPCTMARLTSQRATVRKVPLMKHIA